MNGIDPDGVMCRSGRATVCGVPEDGPGGFPDQRARLKREVLPGHVAAAVFASPGAT